jgi:hypothetical protein
MPKCENCPNWEPKTGNVGWCPIHKCERKINDSCSQGEIVNNDYWGEIHDAKT